MKADALGSVLLPVLAGFLMWLALRSNSAEYMLPFIVSVAVFMFHQQEKKAEADRQLIEDLKWKLRHLMRDD